MIAIGATLPDHQLAEYFDVAQDSCAIGPNQFSSAALAKGKKIVIFGVPGAFTPTCSEQHLPGFVKEAAAIRAKGVDEVWCVSVNDAFVMGAWGRASGVKGTVRMMADGSGEFTGAMGLALDLVKAGLGVRCQRFAMIVDNGVVKHIAVETGGKFEVSSAQAVLAALA